MKTLTFSGTLTEAAHKTHPAIPFTVPPGTTRLVGRFEAGPKRASGALFNNLISLSIFAPDGSRGARHNNPEWNFALDAETATPGYLPGPVTPGEWSVVMDCFRILGPDPITWTLEIDLVDAPVAPRPAQPARVVPQRGPGWYRGDLHAHTIHSDSRWTLEGLVGFARENGLDFVTLTDHNTPSGLAEFELLSDSHLLTMGGVELTTHYGHCLALGTRRWHEWRGNSMPGVTMPGIAAEVEASGALYVIAHPRSPGDPGCTGCRWEYADMMPGPAKAVEIWNGPWSDYNEEGLSLYREWLREGHRLVATAGSDTHGPGPRSEKNGFNTVYVDDLTEENVIAALRAGRNVLSSGPHLIFDLACGEGETAGVGETLANTPVFALIDVAEAEGLELRLIHGDGNVDNIPAPQGRTAIPLNLAPASWMMAELRDSQNVLHAVTNPIWYESRDLETRRAEAMAHRPKAEQPVGE